MVNKFNKIARFWEIYCIIFKFIVNLWYAKRNNWKIKRNGEGARQVGKSYLVNEVLKECQIPYLAFDLEKDDKARREINDTEDFKDLISLLQLRYKLTPGSILFFDEAQECKKLSRYVKSFKEDMDNVKVMG